jgi:hypothetical protein
VRVPESLVRDSRRRTWILTFRRPSVRRRSGLVRPPAAGDALQVAPFTPILALLCISLSVTMAFWNLFH